MPFLDFDTIVVCNNDYDPSSLKQTMRFFYNIGIKHFILTYGIDPAVSSQSHILSTYKNIKSVTRSAKIIGAELLTTYNVHLSAGCLKNPFMQKLTFNNSRRVFLQAPLFIDDWWLMSDLNYLIYNQRLSPIFVAAERNMISYKDDYFERFFHTRTGIFCIDINTITATRYFRQIKHAMHSGIPIIPCISNDLHSYVGALERFEMLRGTLGTKTYLNLCKHLNYSKKQLFSTLP